MTGAALARFRGQEDITKNDRLVSYMRRSIRMAIGGTNYDERERESRPQCCQANTEKQKRDRLLERYCLLCHHSILPPRTQQDRRGRVKVVVGLLV